MFQHAAHPHGSVVVNEIVYGVLGNPEEQIFDGGKRGRFAGLVRPKYDMQIGICLGKRQGHVRKASVSQKIEPVDSHDLVSRRRETRTQIILHMADDIGVVAVDGRFERSVFRACPQVCRQPSGKLAYIRRKLLQ